MKTTAAFVVTLTIDDGANKEDIAAYLQDQLLSFGFDVESVNPWDSPSDTAFNAASFQPPII